MGGMRRAGEAPKVLAPKLGAELAPNAGAAGCAGAAGAPLLAPNVKSPHEGGVVPPKVKTGAGVKAGGADDGGTGASFMDRSAANAASSS